MKKLIFGYSDPGGANQIAAIVNYLKNKKYNKKVCFRILTDKHGYKHKDLLPHIEIIDPRLDKVEEIILDFQPDKIFTAASLLSYIEHFLIKVAKKHEIKSMTFLDHWTSYYEKFIRDGKTNFPDLILLSDDRAKKIAIEQGLPEKKLRIVGNLFYENLMNYLPSISRKEFFDFFELDMDNKILLFISDSISEQNGGYKESINKFGFNEISTFSTVMEELKRLEKSGRLKIADFILLIKLHPKERIDKYNHLITNLSFAKNIVVQTSDISNHDILFYSDFHIGMFSSMVIESIILGKKVLRVEINNIIGDLININNKYYKYIINKSDLSDGLIYLLNQNNLLLSPNFESTILKYI